MCHAQTTAPELVTDRPDFTESSEVVGYRVVQLESGLTLEQSDSSTRQVTALTTSMQQTTMAAAQVAGSARALAQGSSEQAASLEQTSASMEVMASLTRKNVENSQPAAAMMGETEQMVREANASLAQMVMSLGAIKESSDKVSKIFKTIDEIAF